jgi:GT2 family glycosyltransferase
LLSNQEIPEDPEDRFVMERTCLEIAAERPDLVQSKLLDQSVLAVVCVPSFRRPQHLRLTLQSLAAQRSRRRFAVVVVENDAAARESLAVAADFFGRGQLAGLCVVELRQGNCQAINTAFGTALATFPEAKYVLMIDDDEIASPDWLEQMLDAAETSGADVIGGPVWPKFDHQQQSALRDHPAFRPAYDRSGPVPVIYGSGNCLIGREVFTRIGLPAFDQKFNFLGGGDTDFFARCRAAGMRFHWVAEAVITETVPPSRTRPAWLVLRGLRIGVINYRVQRKLAGTPWLKTRLALKVLALLPLSLFRAIGLMLSRRQPLIAMHPIIVAAGTALAAFGLEPQPYKASDIPA